MRRLIPPVLLALSCGGEAPVPPSPSLPLGEGYYWEYQGFQPGTTRVVSETEDGYLVVGSLFPDEDDTLVYFYQDGWTKAETVEVALGNGYVFRGTWTLYPPADLVPEQVWTVYQGDSLADLDGDQVDDTLTLTITGYVAERRSVGVPAGDFSDVARVVVTWNLRAGLTGGEPQEWYDTLCVLHFKEGLGVLEKCLGTYTLSQLSEAWVGGDTIR